MQRKDFLALNKTERALTVLNMYIAGMRQDAVYLKLGVSQSVVSRAILDFGLDYAKACAAANRGLTAEQMLQGENTIPLDDVIGEKTHGQLVEENIRLKDEIITLNARAVKQAEAEEALKAQIETAVRNYKKWSL